MTDGRRTRTAARAIPSKSMLGAKALFLGAAALSLALSMSLWFGGDREQGLFVGLWVPTALALGTLLTGGGSSR